MTRSRVDPASLSEDLCLICQDHCTAPVQLPCGHVFCEDCIFKWLVQQPRCPLCRAPVPDSAFDGFDGITALLPVNVFF